MSVTEEEPQTYDNALYGCFSEASPSRRRMSLHWIGSCQRPAETRTTRNCSGSNRLRPRLYLYGVNSDMFETVPS